MRVQGTGEREQWNGYIRGVMQEIAEEMGIDELPMDDPNFDFYGQAKNSLKNHFGLHSMTLDHVTSDTINVLLHNFNKEGFRGPIYNYQPRMEKLGTMIPFNRYFMTGFNQKALNEIKKIKGYGKNRTKKHLSIEPGRPEELRGPGVAEEELKSGFPAPGAQMEEGELWDEVLPALLAKERNGNILLEFLRLYRQGAKGWEIAERLNELSRENSDYWTKRGIPEGWDPGLVNRLKDTVIEILENYLQRKKLNYRDVSSAVGDRAIFQSRVG